MSKSSVCKLQYVEEREILQSKFCFAGLKLLLRHLALNVKTLALHVHTKRICMEAKKTQITYSNMFYID